MITILSVGHTQHMISRLCDKQAAASPFVSANAQFTDCKDDLHQSGVDSSENDNHLARWNSAPQPAADSQCSEVATSGFGHIRWWLTANFAIVSRQSLRQPN